MATGPIFLLGLQRGGTNQILNILRSHPDTCWPDGEFHQVFRPRFGPRERFHRSLEKLVDYSAYVVTSGDALNPHAPPPQRALRGWRGAWAKRRIARRTRQNAAAVGRFKQELPGVAGPGGERVVVKLVDYNVGLAADLHRLYPDAIFVGLIRDPLPVCEGRTARGRALEKAIATYNYFGAALARLEASDARVLTVRFEDLVTRAEPVARTILAHCELDPEAIRGVLLQEKGRVTDADGGVVGIEKSARVLPFADIGRHMRADANARSIDRLDGARRLRIVEGCASVMAHFGYASEAAGAER